MSESCEGTNKILSHALLFSYHFQTYYLGQNSDIWLNEETEMHIASNRETLFVLTLLTYRTNWMRCLVKIFSFNWLIFAKSLHVCLWTDFEETLYVCVWPTLYVGTVVNLTSKCNNSKNFDAWVLGSFEPNGRTKVNFFTTFLSIPALSFHLLLLSL